MKGNNQYNTSHRRAGTRLYKVWIAMKERCENPRDSSYDRYGGRGIFVCDKWRSSFPAFLADMGERPGERFSIDRIDVNGPYSPGNCRWATNREQCRNKRNTRFLQAFGESKTLVQWSEDLRCRVCLSTLQTRRARGWSIERAMTEPRAYRGQPDYGLPPVPTKELA